MEVDQPGFVSSVLLFGLLVSAVAAALIESKLAQLSHPRRRLSPRIVPRAFEDPDGYPVEGHALQGRGRRWFFVTAVFGCLFLLSQCVGV